MRTLNAYTVPPQKERKAVKELREAGVKAYVPTEPRVYKGPAGRTVRRRVPTLPGYVCADRKPYDAEHVRAKIGTVARTEIARLYVRSSKTQRKHAFASGERVIIKRGNFADIPGTIIEVHRSGHYVVGVDMFGKLCQVRMRERDIAKAAQIRYEPG